jgi:hypothetical protein
MGVHLIALACKNCGAALQIRDGIDDLACGYCGTRLRVERLGGTVYLELAEAVSAIRTGSAQTAAELALVRLNQERIEALHAVQQLEWEVKGPKSRYVEGDLLEGNQLAAVCRDVERVHASIESKKPTAHLAMTAGGVSFALAWLWLMSQLDRGFIGGLLALFSSLLFGLPLLVGAIALPNTLVLGKLEASLVKLQKQVHRHQEMEKVRDQLSQCWGLLKEAQDRLDRIEKDILRNRAIVTSK